MTDRDRVEDDPGSVGDPVTPPEQGYDGDDEDAGHAHVSEDERDDV